MISKNYKLNGFYSWQIINTDGSIASKSKEKNNLILTQGLEFPSVYLFADCFTSCCVGLGTQAPLLSDVGLQSEHKRTNTYYNGANACRSYVSSGTFNIQRTFDFSVETETIYYGEIGWSPENTPGNNLFSKSLMVDSFGNVGPIAVNRNQFLRVIYTLSISFTPSTLTPSVPAISNWTTNGNSIAQLVGLYGVNSSGTTAVFDSGYQTSEPKNNILDIFISTGLQTISGFGNSANYTAGSYPQRATSYPYISGTLTKIYSASFSRASGTGYMNTLGIGLSGRAPANATFIHRLDSPQTKLTDYQLDLYFQYTWGQ